MSKIVQEMPRLPALFSLLAAALLASCGPSVTALATPTSPVSATATAAPSLTPQPTPSTTQTPKPSLTPQPTVSMTQTPQPSPTATLSPTGIPVPSPSPTPGTPVTRTSAPSGECPQPSDQTPTISPISPGTRIVEGFEPQILDYLNAGGSVNGLQAALGEITLTDGTTTWQARTQVLSVDVTADATPEVVMDLSFFEEYQYADGAIFVFTCQEGRYRGGSVARIGGQMLSSAEPDPGIRVILDMNQNGVPDIVYSYIEIVGTHANFTRVFRIMEWDGEHFVDLIYSDHPHYASAATVNNGDGEIKDTDGDGNLELVLTHGPGRGPDAEGEEEEEKRPSIEIWAWDGHAFRRTE